MKTQSDCLVHCGMQTILTLIHRDMIMKMLSIFEVFSRFCKNVKNGKMSKFAKATFRSAFCAKSVAMKNKCNSWIMQQNLFVGMKATFLELCHGV